MSPVRVLSQLPPNGPSAHLQLSSIFHFFVVNSGSGLGERFRDVSGKDSGGVGGEDTSS